MDEVKIPEDLTVHHKATKANRHNVGTWSDMFVRGLIERIAHAEAQVAEADFNFGGWRAIKKRLETQVAALKKQLSILEDKRFDLAVAHTEDLLTIERLTEQLQDADDRADTNLGELNRISQDNAWLREQLRMRSQPVSRAEIERSYRGSGWIGFANRFNQIIAARSAAPGKESQSGVSTGDAGTNGGKA